jgi:hypothetical protein
MSSRDDWIEAIEEYGNAVEDWTASASRGTALTERPRLMDFVGHLLPDADGVPAGMEYAGCVTTHGHFHGVGEFVRARATALYRFRPSAVPTKETEHG